MKDSIKFYLGIIVFALCMYFGVHTENVILKYIVYSIGFIGIISALFYEGKRRVIVVKTVVKNIMDKL
ncbi:hypothetical protein NC516_09130 [Latilactobacillus sakei]|mgnify:CR=1 FL=1|uniref:hypothetical protein n=1 Tax=Latilactobacillus sakei TaxID=1599 RepID=UPI002092BA96|nr:hypothetical protein [Latilactobacillus sakei]USS38531.1 hypothetical protein NC516_09130 [Latilactobacillus sakei]